MTSPFARKPARKPAGRREEVEQARVVQWSHLPSVRAQMPQLRWLHHSPNGGKRDAFTGGQMKAMGVKPGFPDLILPVKSGPFPGLVIEMKDDKGRESPVQMEWRDHFIEQGWRYHLARSAEEVRQVLCRYLWVDPGSVEPLREPPAK
ncbi:MAG: VRR-NUC domain-containing protein [Porticoccaceae bacterium]